MQRDIQVIFNEIKTSFKLINDHFIEDNQRNFFLGLNAEKLSYVGTPDEVQLSKQKLLTLLVDHNTFKNEWNLRLAKPAGGSITGSDLTSLASKIYFFDIEKPNDLGISGVSNEGISSIDLINQVEGDLNSAEFKYTYDARYINFSRLLSDEYATGNEVYLDSDSLELDQYDPNQVTPIGEVDRCEPTVPDGCPLPADPNKPPPPRPLFSKFENLLDLLNTIRITYNFLEGSNFKKFLGADPAIRNNLKINTYEFLELDPKERQTLGYDGKYQIVVEIPDGATDEQKENAIRAAYAEGTDAEFIINKYELFIPEKAEVNNTIKERKQFISLDPGIRTFMTGLSNNDCIKINFNNNKIKNILLKIDKLEQIKKKNKYIRKQLFRKRLKIKYLVDELHWKTINYLINNYETIIIGDMSVKSIVNNKTSNINKITKRIGTSLCFYKFKQRLKYKCILNNCKYIEMNEKYTSKICSNCGNYNKLLEGNKIYNCEKCSITIDRDLNGSRNICLKCIK